MTLDLLCSMVTFLGKCCHIRLINLLQTLALGKRGELVDEAQQVIVCPRSK